MNVLLSSKQNDYSVSIVIEIIKKITVKDSILSHVRYDDNLVNLFVKPMFSSLFLVT